VADVDGDGKDDIVGRRGGNWWVARSTGASFTTQLWGYWVNLGWQDVNIIDVDQDGNADIVGRANNGGLWVARSNGTNGFTNELWGNFAPGNWQYVSVGTANAASSNAFLPTDNDDEETNIFG